MGRPAKVKEEAEMVEATTTNESDILKEFKKMQAQMALMQEQLNKKEEEKNVLSSLIDTLKQGKDTSIVEEEAEVISQFFGELILCTDDKGLVHYNFKQYGEKLMIPYMDLQSICRTNDKFIRQGYFEVCDKKVRQKLGIETHFSKVVSNEELSKIEDMSFDEVSKLYDNANPYQRELICEILNDVNKNKGKCTEVLVMLGHKINKKFI